MISPGSGTVSTPEDLRKLTSWKSIADYFGCDERTAKRWECARGLPVHRLPGGQRSGVFAYTSELDAWLEAGGHEHRALLEERVDEAGVEAGDGESAADELEPATEALPLAVSQQVSRGKPEGHRLRAVLVAAILILASTVGLMLAKGSTPMRMSAADDQPNGAVLDGGTIAAVNASGKQLWRRSFPDGFWKEFYEPGLATRMWFGDLDGSGHSSVLLLYHPAVNAEGRSTTLICFSWNGEEKWRWEAGRALPDIQGEPAVFRSVALGVIGARNGAPPRIVVASVHFPLYPSQIAVIDPSGKTVSEYWHSGHLDFMILADLDGDGRQEIVASGVSNGYHRATLVVLDADNVTVASLEPLRPEIQLHGMGTPHERLRLLFPRSDINLASQNYNAAKQITFSNGTVRVPVLECDLKANCLIWYEFDTRFVLRSVYADDQFRTAHEEFYRSRDRHPFTDKEQVAFEKVECLAGCSFDVAAQR